MFPRFGPIGGLAMCQAPVPDLLVWSGFGSVAWKSVRSWVQPRPGALKSVLHLLVLNGCITDIVNI
jgi:hypothetical protein